MTPGARTATPRWSVLPPHRVSFLADAGMELLSIALDPLPDDAPAVVQFRPSSADSLGAQIEVLLTELDRAAKALFPRWLPGAERFDGSGTLGIPAVRALARRVASQSPDYGPFLADLAERSARKSKVTPPFPAEVRAAGLARVIAAAYARDSAAVLIEVPDGLTPEDEKAFVGAAEWLAHRGRFAVWLTGAPLRAVDRVAIVNLTLPRALARLRTTADDSPEPGPPEIPPTLSIPPVSGLPRADSAAELALERALAPHAWARGREWNRTYEAGYLARAYRLDLFWPDECVVVEVDGSEHRGRLKWADDRDRDNRLHVHGHQVLRFPNEQVLGDIQLVIQQIQHVLTRRRSGARIPEMRHHAD